jgi:hypothetical protein
MKKVQRPSNRLTIRYHEVELVQPRALLVIGITCHYTVDRERRRCERLPVARCRSDPLQYSLVIDRIDQYADNVLLAQINHRA